jgi:sec-independent protein translocase protein TatB
MNVFGIGALEIGLIIIIAVIVIGPERFPEAAVQVARALKFLRGYANDATSELRKEFAELTKEYEDIRKELDEVRGTVIKETGSVTQQMSQVMTETKPALKAPDLNQILDPNKPLIEPGGELPPDRSNGASGDKAG